MNSHNVKINLIALLHVAWICNSARSMHWKSMVLGTTWYVPANYLCGDPCDFSVLSCGCQKIQTSNRHSRYFIFCDFNAIDWIKLLRVPAT